MSSSAQTINTSEPMLCFTCSDGEGNPEFSFGECDEYCSALCALHFNFSCPMDAKHAELLSSADDSNTQGRCFVCRMSSEDDSNTQGKCLVCKISSSRKSKGFVPQNYPNRWLCSNECRVSLIQSSVGDQINRGSAQMAECKGLVGTTESDRECFSKCHDELCDEQGNIRFSLGCECDKYSIDDEDLGDCNCISYCSARCMADDIILGFKEVAHRLDISLFKKWLSLPTLGSLSSGEKRCCVCDSRNSPKREIPHSGGLVVCDNNSCGACLAVFSAGREALKMYVDLFECEKLKCWRVMFKFIN